MTSQGHDMSEFISDIRNSVPSDRVLLPAAEERAGSLLRARLRPETGAELTALLELCRKHKLYVRVPNALCPTNTSFADLDLSRLSRVLDLDPASQLVTVQGGVPAGELETWLEAHGWTLGWYTKDLAMIPINALIQQGHTGFPGPRYHCAQDAVMGFRAILPSGREAWNHTGPRRATGPDLLSILRANMSFGVLTRLVLSVHARSETQILHRVDGTSVQDLLSLAGFTARSHFAPNQLFLVKNESRRNRNAKKSAPWTLFVLWEPNSSSQMAFMDRARFRGLTVRQETITSLDFIDDFAPLQQNVCVRIPAIIPEELLRAVNKSRVRWLISFKSAHDLYLWPCPQGPMPSDDPVLLWSNGHAQKHHDEVAELREQLLLSIDPNGVMHLIGADHNSVIDSKSLQED